VDGENGDDANSGLRWETAVKTIQTGLDKATNGWTVLIADGTYTGAGNKNLDFVGKAIHLKSVGGAANCIIDCENSGRGFYFHSSETNNAIVEGFTIRNGNAGYGGGVSCYESSPTFTNCTVSGNSANNKYGGGVYCWDSSSPTFTNCTISDNSAASGGGVYCITSRNPTFTNCTISDNSGADSGGGVYCWDSSSPTFTNCTISDNSANDGGGVYCEAYSSPTFTNCTISDNSSASDGGGVNCHFLSSPTFTDCTISDNSADYWGGGVFCWDSSSPIFTNCTISGNSADYGGGVLCYENSRATFRNSIIWGNTANSSGHQIYTDHDCSVTLSYSCYANSTDDIAGAGQVNPDNSINDNPQFVDAANKNYHLLGTSPCIDIGNNFYVPAGVTIDLDGNPRIVDGNDDETATVDIGAYEYQP
jgi:parallel beta-helix repeat protein